jgi:Aldehyde dehydrogenase family
VGLPPGVLNVVTADREVSELLVRDQRVDKITFTGSTAAGRRIASICGERIACCTLELGGKSAAVILDDMDIETAAGTLSRAECFLSGQVCSSLTRIVVPRTRHNELVEALAGTFGQVRVGDPFDAGNQMGPLAAQRQRDRVEGYFACDAEQPGPHARFDLCDQPRNRPDRPIRGPGWLSWHRRSRQDLPRCLSGVSSFRHPFTVSFSSAGADLDRMFELYKLRADLNSAIRASVSGLSPNQPLNGETHAQATVGAVRFRSVGAAFRRLRLHGT